MNTIEKKLKKIHKEYYNNNFFTKDEIMLIKEQDIDSIYSKKFKCEDIYILFLLNYIHFKNSNEKFIAAKISFLISYFIFVLWTPPGSEYLSSYYIKKSLFLDPENEEYIDFYKYILSGN